MKDRTIAAIATPVGMGGIAVIRVSGNDAFEICNKVFYGKTDLKNAQSHYEGALQKVGENNTKGLIRTAQELANICPSGDVSKGDKKILRETGYDGTKKMQTLSDNSTTI